MSVDVDKIAEVVLYEGYMLYPYRASTVKNQQRWTFGGVYPRAYSERAAGADGWSMQTQCLLQGSDATEIRVTVRFLQVVDRTVATLGDGELRPAGELRVGDMVYRAWDEASERNVDLGSMRLGDLVQNPRIEKVAIPAGRSQEMLPEEGEAVGALVRTWQSIEGSIHVSAESVPAGSPASAYRVCVRITNETPGSWTGRGSEERQGVLRRSMISTHTILRTDSGEFISLLDPPARHEEAVRECRNEGTWPVLVGEQGETGTLLSSPIILYDYPQIAPESHGNFFDATEIDELLTLSVLTLTDSEKQEMRESDPRSREILERTESLTPDQLMQLHGAVRDFTVLRDGDHE